MNDEIRHLLSGKGQISYGTTIQAVAGYLARGAQSSPLVKTDKRFKREETAN
jgi:hypothetical protein